MAVRPPSDMKRRTIHSVYKKYLFVNINHPSFEYDVNSIVKAFYPDRQVKVLTPESVSLREEFEEVKALGEEVSLEEIMIELTETGAVMTMRVKGSTPESFGAEYEWQSLAGTLADGYDQYKAGFKTFLYKTLEHHAGKSLPWGNLTGIRPTKIAYGLLEEGKTAEEIHEYLQKKVFCK